MSKTLTVLHGFQLFLLLVFLFQSSDVVFLLFNVGLERLDWFVLLFP